MKQKKVQLMQSLLTDFREDLSQSLSQQAAATALTTKYLDVLAHQLRTPLSAIRLNLEMMLDEEELPATLRETILEMHLLAKSMTQTLNDIVLAQEIEKNTLVLHLEAAQPLEILKKILDDYEFEMERKQLTFILEDGMEDCETFILDKYKFTIVLEQLLRNAILYSKEGGSLVFEMSCDATELHFSIEDQGIGMSEKDQAFLFSRFFRGENAVKAAPDCSGLGLYIASHFVRMHGGSLEFHSKEGEGAKVSFVLPVKNAAL